MIAALRRIFRPEHPRHSFNHRVARAPEQGIPRRPVQFADHELEQATNVIQFVPRDVRGLLFVEPLG